MGRPERGTAGADTEAVSATAWVAFVIVAAGGACARYLVEAEVTARTRHAFPLGTLVVNASGSLVLGVLTGLALYHGFPRTSRVVLGTGFCGSYTTFSTFAFQTIELGEDGAVGLAFRNVALTLAVCAATSAAGLILASVF